MGYYRNVKCLLQDVMPSTAVLPTTTKALVLASAQPHNSSPRLADIQGGVGGASGGGQMSTLALWSPGERGEAFPRLHPGINFKL